MSQVSAVKSVKASKDLMLTNNPNNYLRFRPAYEDHARTMFGIGGIMLHTRRLPEFTVNAMIDSTFVPPISIVVPTTSSPTNDAPTDSNDSASGLDSLFSSSRSTRNKNSSTSRDTTTVHSSSSSSSSSAPTVVQVPSIQSRVEEMLLMENIKFVSKQRNEFITMLPRLTGDIMEHLSAESSTIVRRHPDFAQAYATSNALAIWEIVEQTHLVHQIITVAQTAAERSTLDTMKQLNTPLDQYLEKYTDQVTKLRFLKKCPDESTLCSNFLLSLNGTIFGDKVLDMLHTNAMPATFEETTKHICDWYQTERVTKKLMGISTGRQQQPKAEELAHVTTDGKKKGKKKKTAAEKSAAAAAKDEDKAKKASANGSSTSGCSFCKAKGFSFWKGHNTADCRKKKAEETASLAWLESGEVFLCCQTTDIDEDSAICLASTTQEPSILQPGVLVLDPAATFNIIRDAALLHSLHRGRTVKVKGCHGMEKLSEYGYTENFGVALFSPSAHANLISYAVVKKWYKRSFCDDEDKFVLTSRRPVNGEYLSFDFRVNDEGLYVYDGFAATAAVSQSVVACAAMTVNGATYSAEQVSRAREVLRLHETLSHPSDARLSIALDSGILNCHLESSDLRTARKIFGPECPGCLMGKMTRPAAVSSTSEPPLSIGQHVHCDIVFLMDASGRKMPYLFSVDGHTNYLCCAKMSSKAQAQLELHLMRIVNVYKLFGHTVTVIRSDKEHVFDSVRDFLAGHAIQLMQTSPESHERKVERQVRTVRERLRATIHGLPYRLPRFLYPQLVEYVISSLNMVPNIHTGTRCPRELFTNRKVNMATDLRAAFGDLILCKVPNMAANADLAPRAEYAIVVGRDTNSSGNIKVCLLHNKEVVTRRSFKPVPLTLTLSSVIEAMSASDAIPSSDFVDSADSLEPGSVPNTLPSVISDKEQGESPSEQLTDNSQEATQGGGEQPSEAELLPPEELPQPSEVESPPEEPTSPPRTIRFTEPDATTATDNTAPPTAPVVDQLPVANPAPTADAPAAPVHEEPPPAPAPETRQRTLRSSNADFVPGRSWRDAHGHLTHESCALHISMDAAMKINPASTIAAVEAEVKQIVEMGVIDPVMPDSLTPAELAAAIPSLIFCKDKRDAEGNHIKIKGRLCAGGHRLDRSQYSEAETRSSTAQNSTVMMMLCIAAYHGMHVQSIDIAAAYLNANITSRRIHMRLTPQLTAVLVRLYPQYKRFVNRNTGTITVLLKKALYGLLESAKLWFEHMKATLLAYGFTQSKTDPCLFFIPGGPGVFIMLCLHVDDMLVISWRDPLLARLAEHLKKKYKRINVQSGDTLSHLGMSLTFNRAQRSVTISQPGFLADILAHYKVTGTAATPATADLFKIKADSPPVDPSAFASKVMKMNWLASRSRSDILLSVSFLATRSKEPTEDDDRKANRCLRYLNGTRDIATTIQYRPGDKLDTFAFIDASYACHEDAKSHSGTIVAMGRFCAPIYIKSSKQKLVARSSTEAELIALNDGVAQVMWTRNLLQELGLLDKPTVVFQDNQSTIAIAERGGSATGRTKHIAVRYYYIKERLDELDIAIQYLPTENMVADILTKPLTGKLFVKQRKELLNLQE